VHCPHNRNIFAIAVIVVAGDIRIRAVFDFARFVRKTVPYGFAFAIFVPRSLDLEGGGSSAPIKAFREMNRWRRLCSASETRRNGG
jgi:hypothetical protein